MSDSKVVRRGVLEFVKLVRELIELRTKFDTARSRWVSEGHHSAYVRWVAEQGANLVGAPINAETENDLNDVVNGLDAFVDSVLVKLNALKGVN